MVVCYTGGGTLGHIYPALAVHQVMASQSDYRCFWIGRNQQNEQNAVQQLGIVFYPIRSGKLRRYHSLKNVLDVGNLFIAFFQALRILKREKPDVLFSKGGFVSVPPVWAAALLRIPVISHESDASIGLATKLNAPFSKVVCTAYSEGFPRSVQKKMVVTGNPIREELLIQQKLNSNRSELAFLKKGQKLILVLGGSTGSVMINQLIERSLPVLTSYGYVYHQCGQSLQAYDALNYHRVPFITDQLSALLRDADLVICRAGAGTISELALFGCAALLLPLCGKGTRGDQVDNARYLASKKAAKVLYDSIDVSEFVDLVKELLQDEDQLQAMRTAISSLKEPESARKIAQIIQERKVNVCNGV